ncbi:MAG: hypothetical protein AB2551_14930 [Candidatus Thiodiazotropha sp.]
MAITLTNIKDLFSIAAAICVGFWAIYSTIILKEERIAELNVLALEKTVESRSPITSSISTEEIKTDNGEMIVIATVKISNEGNEFARVNINNSVMELFGIDFKNNKAKYSSLRYLKPSLYTSSSKFFSPYLDISPQETYEISFATKLVNKGTYYFNFLSKKSSKSTKLHKENTNSPSYVDYSIGAGKHVVFN